MGMWLLMLGCNLLIPAVMLIAGRLFMKSAPREVNWIIGYRTVMSMKNRDTWQFAHEVVGKFWFQWGWAALGITVVSMLPVLGKSEDLTAAVGLAAMAVQMIPLIAVIPHTEKVLRNTFDKDGNRKENGQCV